MLRKFLNGIAMLHVIYLMNSRNMYFDLKYSFFFNIYIYIYIYISCFELNFETFSVSPVLFPPDLSNLRNIP
jgi:hypothetical protein